MTRGSRRRPDWTVVYLGAATVAGLAAAFAFRQPLLALVAAPFALILLFYRLEQVEGSQNPLIRRLRPQRDEVFAAQATRWPGWYELEVDGVGATQVTDSEGVDPETAVRSFLHEQLGRPPESFQVRLRIVD